MDCDCQVPAICLIVKKEGNNKGRKFYKCQKNICNFFKWNTEIYDPRNFKPGSCFRCGRWGCCVEDCDEKSDFYGNKIPLESWKI